MIRKRLPRIIFQALLHWSALLGTIRWYSLGKIGVSMTHFALSLSTSPSAATMTAGLNSIRSSCRCGSLVIDVFGNPSAKGGGDNGNCTSRNRAINCHCRGCRRYHTGAYASFLETDWSNIFVRQGRDKIGKFSSDCNEFGPVERWFCKNCSSKLLLVPQHLFSSEETAHGDGGDKVDDDDDKEEKKYAERKIAPDTKCLLNLGPVIDDTIHPDTANCWKEQLDRSENNLHFDKTKSVWARALPENEDRDYIYDDDHCQTLPTPLKWFGGCACGACRYEFILTHPTEMQHCYCRLCRELSGSPFMTWIPVEKRNFRWIVCTKGVETETLTSSSALQLVRTTPFGSRHVCNMCQSVMTIVYDEQPDTIWPCAGSLDDSALPKSTEEMGETLSRVCHICCRYKPTWLRIRRDGMERIEEAC